MDDRLRTLFYPFDTGMLDWPGRGANVLFLGAEPGFRRPADETAGLACVQGFRPQYLALRNQGLDVQPEPAGADYAAALILCGRFRAANEQNLSEALTRVRAGGLIVIAGGKTDGIASLRKRGGSLLPIAGAQSKYHGTVFWLERPADAGRAIEALSHPPGSIEGGFRTGPGMFSADGVDPGSRLLADSLPDDLSGEVADFAAGWGYLSARVADREKLRRIDLYEASSAALEAAKINMANSMRGDLECRYHWHDLLKEPVAERYDAIVMNPPFHQGRAAQPDIGLAMIRTALQSLKKGGRLFLVANRGLPYRRELEAIAAASGELAPDNRFQLLWARK